MIVFQEARNPNQENNRLLSIKKALKRKQFRVLIIEPTSKCNLKCSFCDMHNDSLDTNSKKINMELSTFNLIIQSLKKLDYKLKSIQLHGYGEPLLHKQIIMMVQNLKPFTENLRIITNGTALNEKVHDKLVNAGIDEIHISVDVTDRFEYKRIKAKDLYGKVIENLEKIIPKYKKINNTHLFIKVSLPSQEYENFWGEKSVTYDNYEQSVKKFTKIVESSKNIHLRIAPLFSTYKTNSKILDNTACEMPFYMLKIKSNGMIDTCCAALFDELSVGHIKNGLNLHHKASKIRKAHLSGNVSKFIPICGSCNAKTETNIFKIKGEIKNLV